MNHYQTNVFNAMTFATRVKINMNAPLVKTLWENHPFVNVNKDILKMKTLFAWNVIKFVWVALILPLFALNVI
jgi:hypothetical protein